MITMAAAEHQSDLNELTKKTHSSLSWVSYGVSIEDFGQKLTVIDGIMLCMEHWPRPRSAQSHIDTDPV